jgi:predicted negative regulator of RcsB-dependent stress response
VRRNGISFFAPTVELTLPVDVPYFIMLYRACRANRPRRSMRAGVALPAQLKRKEMTRHSSATARRARTDSSFDDVFVARAFEASSWANRNRQKVTIAAVAFIVAILALIWYSHYRSTMADKATTELTRVRATVQSGNTQLAISDLQKYIDRFGGTKTADEARLMLAQQYLISSQPQKAVDIIKPAADNPGTAAGAQASLLLAQAYEAAKSSENAEKEYLALADKAPYLYMKQDALDNAARLNMQRDNPAGAADLLQRLLDITPETAPERDVFNLRLGEALIAAGKPIPAAPAIAK